MIDVRGIVAKYCKEDISNITDSDIIEVITDCGDEVWSGGDLEESRWYLRQNTVVEIEGYYVVYPKYILTGDASMGDMGLSYSIDDFTVVEKKTRMIEETYYK